MSVFHFSFTDDTKRCCMAFVAENTLIHTIQSTDYIIQDTDLTWKVKPCLTAIKLELLQFLKHNTVWWRLFLLSRRRHALLLLLVHVSVQHSIWMIWKCFIVLITLHNTCVPQEWGKSGFGTIRDRHASCFSPFSTSSSDSMGLIINADFNPTNEKVKIWHVIITHEKLCQSHKKYH